LKKTTYHLVFINKKNGNNTAHYSDFKEFPAGIASFTDEMLVLFNILRSFLRSGTINHRIRNKLFAKLQLSERGRRKQVKLENMRSEMSQHLQFALVFHRPIRIHTLETECVSALFLRFLGESRATNNDAFIQPPVHFSPAARERLAQWCWWCGGGVVVDYLTAGCTSATL
jgi:hypothetical protein